MMKTKKSLNKMTTTPFEELPTVKKVLGRIKEEDGNVTYQEALLSCFCNRIKAQDTDLLTHAVTILATKGWERCESSRFGHEALNSICQRFQIPLEAATVDCSVVLEEWDDMVDYAKKYLNLVQEDYKVLWWKLFNSVDAQQWVNVLGVVQLLFCLPMSNGHLEQVFSQLKLIKVNRRTCLGEDTLDHLIRINVEGPPLSKWQASHALELWDKDKIRRVNRKEPLDHSVSLEQCTSAESAVSDDEHFSLDDWEEWIELN
uniref:HAT C-terminal dimerisation domain-containing protein n=1 Tax=Amphimedon queenslandica TaxID=400682 RepID=A0A1X7TLB5_AMPQE